MSKILRRPMFRGGRVESRGTGIVSGFAKGGSVDTPKRGLVDGPGGYAGRRGTGTEVIDIAEKIRTRMPRPTPKLSVSDYLQIASTGLDVLGRPSEGSGFGGALRTASKPLSQLGQNLAKSFSAQDEVYEDQIKGYTGAQAEYNIGMEKALGEVGRKEIMFDAITETKRKNIQSKIGTSKIDAKGNPTGEVYSQEDINIELTNLQNKAAEDKEIFIVKGGDLSDFTKLASNKEVSEAASKAAKNFLKAKGIAKTDPEYSQAYAREMSKFMGEITKGFVKNFAEGGQVTETEDVNMETVTPGGIADFNIEEQTTTSEPLDNSLQQLSYEEIREKLPPEVTDDIVKLLSTSYEALADFVEIRDEADVINFNTQYQVDLKLPQEA